MRHELVPARVCASCGDWPCRCQAPAPPMPDLRPLWSECACGLLIKAETRIPSDVQDAVLRHNIEPLHLAWRERVGLS